VIRPVYHGDPGIRTAEMLAEGQTSKSSAHNYHSFAAINHEFSIWLAFREVKRWTGSAAYKNGISPKGYGKCEHAISVPGSNYDIGVVRKSNGNYTLVWDFYGTGQVITRTVGRGCEELLQLYGVHKAILEARRRGCRVQPPGHQGSSHPVKNHRMNQYEKRLHTRSTDDAEMGGGTHLFNP